MNSKLDLLQNYLLHFFHKTQWSELPILHVAKIFFDRNIDEKPLVNLIGCIYNKEQSLINFVEFHALLNPKLVAGFHQSRPPSAEVQLEMFSNLFCVKVCCLIREVDRPKIHEVHLVMIFLESQFHFSQNNR